MKSIFLFVSIVFAAFTSFAQNSLIAVDDIVFIENYGDAFFDPTLNDIFDTPVIVVSFTQPNLGVVTIENNSNIMHYESLNYYYNANEIIEYTIEDQNGELATANIFFQTEQGELYLNDDFFSTENDECISFDVLLNDAVSIYYYYYYYSFPFDITSFTHPEFGTLTFDTLSQTFEYCPNADFIGSDSFTYQVDHESFATVSIEVFSPSIPNAVNDTIQTSINQLVVIDVLDNDEFFNIPVIADIANPENGTVIISAVNSLVYTPNENFTGTDCFEYAILDTNNLNFDIALVCVEVGGVVNLNDTFENKDLTIYPNPTSTSIQFTLNKPNQFQLLNANGELIIEQFANDLQVEIDVSRFSNGIYYLKVNNQIAEFMVF